MMTKHLEDCFKQIKEDPPKQEWFECDQITPFLSRRRWVCDRLVEEGKLEKEVLFRVPGDYTTLYSVYKIKEQTAT